MKKFVNLFTLLFCTLAAFALEVDPPAEPVAKDAPDTVLQHELVMMMSGQQMNLDPATSCYNSEAQVLNGLYEGLFTYNSKTLEPVPAIAQSYKISKNKKRWTFTIRQGLKFSDGTPITASSVRDAWILLLSTPEASYASLLDCIDGVAEFRNGQISQEQVGIKAKDDSTLIVNLKSPTAYFSRLLCHHAFSVFKEDRNVFSGPYIISSRTDSEILLTKNEHYYDAKNVHIPSIKILLSSDYKENTWLFNTGRADWVVSLLDTERLLNKNSMRLSAIFGTSYLFFSCNNTPWDKADFRNALLTAIPWQQLRTSLIPATTLVYPLSGYKSPEGLTETSEEDALEMMEEARKNASIPQDEKLSITFAISQDSELEKKQAEILKKAWEPLGVELKLEVIPDHLYLSSMNKSKSDIFSYSWIGDYADPSAFLELFREGSTLNQTKWHNQEFTQIFTLSDETTDSAERYKLLSQAESILLNDGMIIPVSHSLSLHALDLNLIGGWYTNALDIHPFKDMFFKESQVSQIPNIAALLNN